MSIKKERKIDDRTFLQLIFDRNYNGLRLRIVEEGEERWSGVLSNPYSTFNNELKRLAGQNILQLLLL